MKTWETHLTWRCGMTIRTEAETEDEARKVARAWVADILKYDPQSDQICHDDDISVASIEEVESDEEEEDKMSDAEWLIMRMRKEFPGLWDCTTSVSGGDLVDWLTCQIAELDLLKQ